MSGFVGRKTLGKVAAMRFYRRRMLVFERQALSKVLAECGRTVVLSVVTEFYPNVLTPELSKLFKQSSISLKPIS